MLTPRRRVNLGGWLVLEPFISPAMFQPYYPNAVDEWTLSEFLRADTTANGGINKIEEHYKTFITEQVRRSTSHFLRIAPASF